MPWPRAVALRQAEFGMLVCTTGVGMSIAANKVPGVRAALATDEETAILSRQHNNANILCLAAKSTTPREAGRIARGVPQHPLRRRPP